MCHLSVQRQSPTSSAEKKCGVFHHFLICQHVETERSSSRGTKKEECAARINEYIYIYSHMKQNAYTELIYPIYGHKGRPKDTGEHPMVP